MSSERDRAIARGQQAEALMNNEALKDALDQMKAGMLEGILTTRPDDTRGRENLYLQAKLVDAFRDQLHKTIANGKYESAAVARIDKR